MKKLFYIGLLLSLYSCGPRIYSYKFSMKESKETKKLYYENDTMSISFNFYPKGIKVDFTNKSDSVIKINWDQVKMTENDIEKKIVCLKKEKGNFKVVQSSSLISPKAKASGLLVYEYNIFYLKKFGKQVLTIKDMYPGTSVNKERKFVEKLIGTRVTLNFPTDIYNTTYNKTFNFRLEEIYSTRQVGAEDFLLMPLFVLGGM